MTTLVLFIIASVIVYYLYITLQEYLKNPISATQTSNESENLEYNFQDDPYIKLTPFDKLKGTYAGIGTRILNKFITQALKTNTKDSKDFLDSRTTLLQRALIENFINSASNGVPNSDSTKKDLLSILEQSEETDIETLAQDLANSTYGEYKKRLNFVTLLLMLGWSDLNLSADEQEFIFDVAAYLEIENSDFNELYDNFSKENPKLYVAQYLELFTESKKPSKAKDSTESNDANSSDAESKEIFINQAKSILTKSQKLKEDPKETMNKLLDLQEAYEQSLK